MSFDSEVCGIRLNEFYIFSPWQQMWTSILSVLSIVKVPLAEAENKNISCWCNLNILSNLQHLFNKVFHSIVKHYLVWRVHHEFICINVYQNTFSFWLAPSGGWPILLKLLLIKTSSTVSFWDSYFWYIVPYINANLLKSGPKHTYLGYLFIYEKMKRLQKIERTYILLETLDWFEWG